ncbi:hypothetical protein SS50377_28203 [Spironucleus salmonicida]|uniref:Uncharacterized protein n=1 Tax=Spironucleus salmonicida TaxID=348837 RepID=V6LRN2_9EUKA|nr:hypothetical protein SS50377_28203 [Spironucleus salmonicida]|eukprot:EST46356.1 Hypothetical protein SS50377_13599 [Spironucleus salmonicida]
MNRKYQQEIQLPYSKEKLLTGDNRTTYNAHIPFWLNKTDSYYPEQPQQHPFSSNSIFALTRTIQQKEINQSFVNQILEKIQ